MPATPRAVLRRALRCWNGYFTPTPLSQRIHLPVHSSRYRTAQSIIGQATDKLVTHCASVSKSRAQCPRTADVLNMNMYTAISVCT